MSIAQYCFTLLLNSKQYSNRYAEIIVFAA